MSEFPLHLSAFRALQLQYQEKYRNGSGRAQSMISPPAEKYLNTIFYLQSTLSLSTDCDLTPVPWPTHPQRACRRESSLYAILALDDDCLQYTYGTTTQITMFIHATATLFRSISYYASEGGGVPESLLQAIRNLSEKVDAWSIDLENIINFPSVEMGKVMRMHILAFHNATCIFVLTHLILPLSADPEARQTLSGQIRFHSSQSLSRLQSIEDIKQQTSRVFQHQTASILWPGFIASCEAAQEDRPGWIAWWEQMLTYRIGNIASLYETVVDVWHLADRWQNSSSSLPAWRMLLREKGRVIIAL
ncbi:fungal-specific transcription factor domain-containing protein [Aspergillus pseudoustus]|uniref:Fungal-specific transcription factor domain-containing protein n=1 Tax=Aspergillus pseudoustus TaxID=1810923 RepID=A0ABR4J6J4_9EURO